MEPRGILEPTDSYGLPSFFCFSCSFFGNRNHGVWGYFVAKNHESRDIQGIIMDTINFFGEYLEPTCQEFLKEPGRHHPQLDAERVWKNSGLKLFEPSYCQTSHNAKE